MNWVMEHMADPDFAEPFVPPGAKKDTGKLIQYYAKRCEVESLMLNLELDDLTLRLKHIKNLKAMYLPFQKL